MRADPGSGSRESESSNLVDSWDYAAVHNEIPRTLRPFTSAGFGSGSGFDDFDSVIADDEIPITPQPFMPIDLGSGSHEHELRKCSHDSESVVVDDDEIPTMPHPCMHVDLASGSHERESRKAFGDLVVADEAIAITQHPSATQTINSSRREACKHGCEGRTSHSQWMDMNQRYCNDLVILHVYDAAETRAVGIINKACDAWGSGAFHVGVELQRREHSYGSNGVRKTRPRTYAGFRGSINLGKTFLSLQQQKLLLKDLRKTWLGNKYNAIYNNCVHFAEVFASQLGVAPVPDFLNSLAKLGSSLLSPFNYAWNTIRKLKQTKLDCRSDIGRPTCSTVAPWTENEQDTGELVEIQRANDLFLDLQISQARP